MIRHPALVALSAAMMIALAQHGRADSNNPASKLGLTTGWTATVTYDPVVARDPAWTAIVYARIAAPELSAPLETAALTPHLAPRPTEKKTHVLDGIASFYRNNQATASGEAFDKRAMTAAHPTLPMGTKVRVTNLSNGHSAILRINDRGPYVPGRVIDVSEAAAEALGMLGNGLAAVRVDPIAD